MPGKGIIKEGGVRREPIKYLQRSRKEIARRRRRRRIKEKR